ncbi:stemmadenine O-acetyltransferase-like [Humulus lupulus]|uniref:stemmadenine O-acetyltransferase-like n=1 Tax=Humulus lupulus TaxID=3486 RepID=UPI002B414FC9|nr:stemmadenine O-acetyltransferase-like [Humulus lupulus]
MELSIISRETVKPSSPHDHLKPYKLCLFDQITPMTYISLVIFYSTPDQNFNSNLTQTLSHLKKSLSETLNLFYPLSGKTKENLYVDEFDTGVTYIEAKVSCSLTDFFKLSQTELLNKFVPYHPLRNEVVEPSSREELPQIGFQVNVFACGGIALGTSFGHKVADAGTVSYFLKAWASSSRHSTDDDITGPNYSNASLVFPPMYSVPQKYRTITDKKWFSKKNLVTKRLVFDADSIATLKDLAKSEQVPRPSRNDVLSCFIWKHSSEAAAAAKGGAARASVAVLAVNLRPRMKSKLPLDSSLGNLFWWTRAPVSDARMGLGELVVVLRESLVSFNECLKRSEESDDVGFALVSEYYDAMEAAVESPETDVYIFTNWSGFYNEVDFGWGKPIWIGAHGKMGGERFMKVHVLLEIPGGNGVEVFLTLEEDEMAVLEKDPKFLEFASFNPRGVPGGEPFHRSA